MATWSSTLLLITSFCHTAKTLRVRSLALCKFLGYRAKRQFVQQCRVVVNQGVYGICIHFQLNFHQTNTNTPEWVRGPVHSALRSLLKNHCCYPLRQSASLSRDPHPPSSSQVMVTNFCKEQYQTISQQPQQVVSRMYTITITCVIVPHRIQEGVLKKIKIKIHRTVSSPGQQAKTEWSQWSSGTGVKRKT